MSINDLLQIYLNYSCDSSQSGTLSYDCTDSLSSFHCGLSGMLCFDSFHYLTATSSSCWEWEVESHGGTSWPRSNTWLNLNLQTIKKWLFLSLQWILEQTNSIFVKTSVTKGQFRSINNFGVGMLFYICSVSEAQVHGVFLVRYLSCSRPSVNVLSSHQNAAST